MTEYTNKKFAPLPLVNAIDEENEETNYGCKSNL
jgi:hypothetical protein